MKKDRDQRRQNKLRELRKAARDERGRTHVVAPTTNGRLIQELLIQSGRNPNRYKDWCARTTGRLVDWVSTYNVSTVEGPAPVDGAELVHKRNIHAMYPKPFADSLWNVSLSRRRPQKAS
jgi:hypothetical protein